MYMENGPLIKSHKWGGVTFYVTADSKTTLKSHYKDNAQTITQVTGKGNVYKIVKAEKKDDKGKYLGRADEIMYFRGEGLKGNRKVFSLHWNWKANPQIAHPLKPDGIKGYTKPFIEHYRELLINQDAPNTDKTTHIIFTSGHWDYLSFNGVRKEREFKNETNSGHNHYLNKSPAWTTTQKITKKEIFTVLTESGFTLNKDDMDSMIATNQNEIDQVKSSTLPLKFYFLNTNGAVPLYQDLTSDKTANNKNEVLLFIHTTC